MSEFNIDRNGIITPILLDGKNFGNRFKNQFITNFGKKYFRSLYSEFFFLLIPGIR
ncbi:hypothetical protein LEP1GSC172_3445 [Leptospira noguchii]|uniref:Uncharacterized protein n=1 Tax=Leptospira noguchii TaxID=28182 RepID=M6VQT3_9LEPT|nr:hypothetical protein LEP1GSC172_3445 [Leptospira noguchii]